MLLYLIRKFLVQFFNKFKHVNYIVYLNSIKKTIEIGILKNKLTLDSVLSVL